MHALLAAVVLSCCRPCPEPTREELEANERINLALRSWKPSEHVWTIAGAATTFVAVGLGVAGSGVLIGSSVDSPSDAVRDNHLGWGLLGAGFTALAAAIVMVIYNATL